jgi:hypothetical protein
MLLIAMRRSFLPQSVTQGSWMHRVLTSRSSKQRRRQRSSHCCITLSIPLGLLRLYLTPSMASRAGAFCSRSMIAFQTTSRKLSALSCRDGLILPQICSHLTTSIYYDYTKYNLAIGSYATMKWFWLRVITYHRSFFDAHNNTILITTHYLG